MSDQPQRNEIKTDAPSLKRRKSVYEKVMLSDVELCQRVFKTYDTQNKGYIDYFQLKRALEEVGVHYYYSQNFHKMVSGLRDQSGQISFFDFTKICVKHKKELEDDTDVFAAFVAMGGGEDGSGSVDSEKLIDILKNQYDLTIDIEGMIKEIDQDNSGELEFDEFRELLDCTVIKNPEILNFKEWFTF